MLILATVRDHNGDRPHKCQSSGCKKDFKRKHHLEVHGKHQSPGEAAVLILATGYVHGDDRLYRCTVSGCEERFKTEADRKRHGGS